MDADQYVPITTVASLDQIQKFNCDIQLIVELLRGTLGGNIFYGMKDDCGGIVMRRQVYSSGASCSKRL